MGANPLDMDRLIKKHGVKKRTSSKIKGASASDSLPLSKRKQTGRNIFEETNASDSYDGAENDLQDSCEGWLLRNKIRFIRIPGALFAFIYRKSHKGPPGFSVWLYRLLMPLRKIVSYYFSGVPDLIILFQNGRYLCAELKNKKGAPTGSQKKFSGLAPVHIFRDLESLKKKSIEVGDLENCVD